MKNKNRLSSALAIVFILMLAACLNNISGNEKVEIEKITEAYITSLLPQVREAGVREINIVSANTTIKSAQATAKLEIVFKVYNPETNQIREDKDVATFSLKKSNGKWEIADVKYQKTRW